MTQISHCPDGCYLLGEEIPELMRALYEEGATNYSRLIGVEVRGIYDGVAYWACPDCGIVWHRFPPGDRRRSAVNGHWLGMGIDHKTGRAFKGPHASYDVLG